MILIDAGPLVALNDKRDSSYRPCRRTAATIPNEPLVTSWPCFAEAMYLLGTAGGFPFQAKLWQMCREGYLSLVDLSRDEIDMAATMMEKYHDHPMDLGDATLMAIADIRGWPKVFTLDTHFFSYRLRSGAALHVILPTKD